MYRREKKTLIIGPWFFGVGMAYLDEPVPGASDHSPITGWKGAHSSIVTNKTTTIGKSTKSLLVQYSGKIVWTLWELYQVCVLTSWGPKYWHSFQTLKTAGHQREQQAGLVPQSLHWMDHCQELDQTSWCSEHGGDAYPRSVGILEYTSEIHT